MRSHPYEVFLWIPKFWKILFVESGIRDIFGEWNPESWDLERVFQIKESGIIRYCWNPEHNPTKSTEKKSGIQ